MFIKKRSNPIAVFIKTLIIIIAVPAILFFTLSVAKAKAVSYAKEKIAKAVIESTAYQVAGQFGIDESDVDAILDKVDDVDKQAVYDIIDDHMDKETIQQAVEYAKSGDVDSIKEMARDILTEEEKQTIKSLYHKYLKQ